MGDCHPPAEKPDPGMANFFRAARAWICGLFRKPPDPYRLANELLRSEIEELRNRAFAGELEVTRLRERLREVHHENETLTRLLADAKCTKGGWMISISGQDEQIVLMHNALFRLMMPAKAIGGELPADGKSMHGRLVFIPDRGF